MIKNYKKGKVLMVEYVVAPKKSVITSYGIVFEKTDSKLVLVHNFSGTDKKPIDIIKIPLNDILKSKEIIPREINQYSDLIS